MIDALEFALCATFIGVGATFVMDVWALFQRRVLSISTLNYAMVGRWIGHLPFGKFAHASIAAAAPIPGERLIGWTAHYAIGVVFAGILLAVWGLGWARQPTLVPALIVGVATVVAPFFIMQPGMGLGIAAAKTPKPNVARLRSIITHTIFGVGVYGTASLWALLR
jgi:hypothetical protein